MEADVEKQYDLNERDPLLSEAWNFVKVITTALKGFRKFLFLVCPNH
jgi:hypothetical protein